MSISVSAHVQPETTLRAKYVGPVAYLEVTMQDGSLLGLFMHGQSELTRVVAALLTLIAADPLAAPEPGSKNGIKFAPITESEERALHGDK